MSEDEKETERSTVSATSVPGLTDDGDMGKDDLYKYRDFSQIKEEDDDVVGEAVAPPTNARTGESSIRSQKFPVKLYTILAQKEFNEIIVWMPHGRSFKVLKPNLFESLVMPLFFEYSNYHSFNRLVNAWSFRRMTAGPDRGSYYHEVSFGLLLKVIPFLVGILGSHGFCIAQLFLRGKPHLMKYMRRLPKSHKKQPMKKEDEPDFYKLAQQQPLPALEDAPIPGLGAVNLNQQQSVNASSLNSSHHSHPTESRRLSHASDNIGPSSQVPMPDMLPNPMSSNFMFPNMLPGESSYHSDYDMSIPMDKNSTNMMNAMSMNMNSGSSMGYQNLHGSSNNRYAGMLPSSYDMQSYDQPQGMNQNNLYDPISLQEMPGGNMNEREDIYAQHMKHLQQMQQMNSQQMPPYN